MIEKRKILVCGDVEGKFNALFNRISTINEKSGPFDALFCVGNFFGVNNREFDAFKNGTKKMPIPIYILGPNCPEHVDLYPLGDTMDLCHNVYYLGKRGLFTDSNGLKIAYISGISSNNPNSSYEYTNNDVTEVYNSCLRGNPSFRGIDLLLTWQWPNGIIPNDSKKLSLTINKTSDMPSWLLLKLKPRYHISGLEGIYYESPPFRAPNLGDHDTTINLATRFLGLARVGNPNKEKWLYALSLTPLEKMKISDLLQKTTDEIQCPFDFDDMNRRVFNVKTKRATTNQYFYDTEAPAETEHKSRKKRQKVEFDQSKCWFCLASPSVEKHLIITVANSTYLALAKGPIVEEHFLICPIEHYQSSLNQPSEVRSEITQFKEALKKFYARTDKVPVFFERNYKTSHMQLQSIPVPKRASKELKDIFMDEAQGHGLKLEVLESRLNQVVQDKVPFFTVELPDGTILYTTIKGNFPLNFGREVLATGPVLNCTAKSDWRECMLKRDEEEALVRRIRTDFEPFDFTEL